MSFAWHKPSDFVWKISRHLKESERPPEIFRGKKKKKHAKALTESAWYVLCLILRHTRSLPVPTAKKKKNHVLSGSRFPEAHHFVSRLTKWWASGKLSNSSRAAAKRKKKERKAWDIKNHMGLAKCEKLWKAWERRNRMELVLHAKNFRKLSRPPKAFVKNRKRSRIFWKPSRQTKAHVS